MFGISFTELAMIATIALIVVGPQKLPGMLRTLGEYVSKLRRLSTEVRQQTGIDDILRQEGIHGGLNELRGMLRGADPVHPIYRPAPLAARSDDPYPSGVPIDHTREYPVEGADAAGVLADDLFEPEALAAVSTAPAALTTTTAIETATPAAVTTAPAAVTTTPAAVTTTTAAATATRAADSAAALTAISPAAQPTPSAPVSSAAPLGATAPAPSASSPKTAAAPVAVPEPKKPSELAHASVPRATAGTSASSATPLKPLTATRSPLKPPPPPKRPSSAPPPPPRRTIPAPSPSSDPSRDDTSNEPK